MKPKCKECGSNFVYVTMKGIVVCRRCGNRSAAESSSIANKEVTK